MKLLLSKEFIKFLNEQKENYKKPVFIYNLDTIKERMSWLSGCAHKYDINLMMAAKSFPNEEIYKIAAKYLDGIDVSNAIELEMVLPYFNEKIISVTGPLWHLQDEFDVLKNKRDLYINAGNCDQWKILNESSWKNVGIRLSFDEVKEGRSIVSRFGLPIEILNDVNGRIGLHFHKGFSNNTAEFYYEALLCLIDKAQECNVKIDYINLGGGLRNVDPETFFKTIREIAGDLKLFMEPGDFLFSGSGFFLTKIIEITKRKQDSLRVSVDSSKDCHLKWSEPFYALPQSNEKLTTVLNLFGATCYENDFIGAYQINADENILRSEGFIILGGVTGYSYSWNHQFNGVPEASLKFFSSRTSEQL